MRKPFFQFAAYRHAGGTGMLETMQDVVELATAPDARERLVRRFMRVRGWTVGLVAPLTPKTR